MFKYKKLKNDFYWLERSTTRSIKGFRESIRQVQEKANSREKKLRYRLHRQDIVIGLLLEELGFQVHDAPAETHLDKLERVGLGGATVEGPFPAPPELVEALKAMVKKSGKQDGLHTDKPEPGNESAKGKK